MLLAAPSTVGGGSPRALALMRADFKTSAGLQAVVATIVSDADDYANDVAEKLRAAGLRVETDLRNEKINYKVREHSLAKVANLLVVGKREAEEGTVALRVLGSDEHQKVLSLEDAIARLTAEAKAPDLG